MDIESVPGVGEKTAAALSELEDPERALREGDVATIAQAPGISPGRAARLARAAIRDRHDDPGGFAATPRAKDIHAAALSLLTERTVTDSAAARLETLYPSASASRIEEVRRFVSRAMDRPVDGAVLDALESVEPLAEPRDVRVRDRCLATQDAECYAAAQAAIPELSVELVDDARQLADLASGYSTVVALDSAFAGVDIDGDVRVEPDALSNPASVVPERILAFFAANRKSLRAATAVHDAAGLETPVDTTALTAALDRLEADGTVGGDAELERLAAAVDDLDTAVSAAERAANDHLETVIEERDVTIEGTDLLSLVEQGAGVDSLLERELADEFETAVDRARETLVETLDLQETETRAHRVFGDDPTYPVSRNERAVSRLRQELTALRDRRATRRKRETAAELAGMREDCAAMVDRALELDVELAIARFVADFDCVMPTIDGEGFEIHGGRSPLLDVPFEAVEPVDYGVEGVTLLSGVNSGGKTSTLDLVALLVTLAHMGLPVPAEKARVEPIGELHYHAKTQGTLDAGAFEATVREFATLVGSIEGPAGPAGDDDQGGTATTADGDGDDSGPTGERSVLVLVDELESITEPGASANIIAGILEALDDRAATAVFVSHLAGEIRDVAAVDIAVDGIRAQGLADGELVVDRSPVKGTLARSTPELIVEKLAAETDDAFYERLLEKFEG